MFALARSCRGAAAKESPSDRIPKRSLSDHCAARLKAFQQGLRDVGYVEGKNIVYEYRYAERKIDRLPALAAELVRLKVDVIATMLARNPRPPISDEYHSYSYKFNRT